MNPYAFDADAHQAEIYRRMTPGERLQQAVRLNRQMRSLMEAGIRATHPEWSPRQRQQEIARRILHARTG